PLRPLERAARDLGVQLYYHAIDSERIPDVATVRGFDALEDVLFVGYPSGVWDQVNLMPILRRGTTAARHRPTARDRRLSIRTPLAPGALPIPSADRASPTRSRERTAGSDEVGRGYWQVRPVHQHRPTPVRPPAG
ncbi:MAG: hypothetical protein J0H57_04305, partial [Rhodospirillales bacterium]|nr:hypothetical protein [Rhodospirillales bacterium]